MIEIVKDRNETMKVYDTGGGVKKAIIHCKPIHYYHAGDWKEIKNDFTDSGSSFVRSDAKIITKIRKENSRNLILSDRGGCVAEISIDSIICDSKQVSLRTLSALARKRECKSSLYCNGDIFNISYDVNEVSSKIWVEILSPVSSFMINKSIKLTKLKCSNLVKDGYYIPDEYGRFNFVRDDNSLMFYIPTPKVKDANGNTFHSFNHSLTADLNYSKFPINGGFDDLVVAKYPIKTDASPYYASSSDGFVNLTGTDVDTVHHATTGGYASTTDANSSYGLENYYYSSKTVDVRIGRSFFYFDTSDIPDAATIDSASLSVYIPANYVTVYVQKGTQADTLTADDYDSFSGDAYGSASAEPGYYTMSFNNTGKSEINKTGTTKLCVRNRFDYLDTMTSCSNTNLVVYYSEYTGTDHDPYLSITYTEGSSSTIKTVNGLAKASVATADGLANASVKTWNGLA